MSYDETLTISMRQRMFNDYDNVNHAMDELYQAELDLSLIKGKGMDCDIVKYVPILAVKYRCFTLMK